MAPSSLRLPLWLARLLDALWAAVPGVVVVRGAFGAGVQVGSWWVAWGRS